MSCPICETCGTQFAESPTPAAACPVCEDERQYVGWSGQRWTTHDELAQRHRLRIDDDAGLLGIGIEGNFAIPQRALRLPVDAGNILWECVSLVTDEAVALLRARGGIAQIVISHPHFYSSMVQWSDALGGVPILLHRDDKGWVQRPSRAIRYWDGDALRLSPEVTLIRTGGHFAGSTVLHWSTGPRGAGALFSGDSPQVVADRRHLGFMRSYPNLMPMRPADVRAMRSRLAGLEFDDVYGFTWGRNILGGARAALDASFERYLQAVADEPECIG